MITVMSCESNTDPANQQIAEHEPFVVVLSGPGGVGKGTVVNEWLKNDDSLWLSRSWSSRARREGEAEDAYNFVSREQFMEHVENGGFLEWVEFLDYLQGTPVPNPPEGLDVLLEIDVGGAEQIKAIFPRALLLFIDAPTIEEQKRRLYKRGDSEERIAQRLEKAAEERERAKKLGCVFVVNDVVEKTVEELKTIVARTKQKI